MISRLVADNTTLRNSPGTEQSGLVSNIYPAEYVEAWESWRRVSPKMYVVNICWMNRWKKPSLSHQVPEVKSCLDSCLSLTHGFPFTTALMRLWCLTPTWTNWDWMIAETGSIFCQCLSQIPRSACWMRLPPPVWGWAYLLRICPPHPYIALLSNGPRLVLSQHTTWEVLTVVLMIVFSGTSGICRTSVICRRLVSPHSRTYSMKWYKVDIWHNPESRLKNSEVQVDSVLIDIIWWCWLTKRALKMKKYLKTN